MGMTALLPGVQQKEIQTSSLHTAYLEAGAGDVPVVLIHGNCSSSTYFQDFMLLVAASGPYHVYALDLRGYGDTETLPLDATRGVQDFADDLESWVQALVLPAFHLFGWSLGGNIVMQYAISYPGRLKSLTLQAPGSPYGFGGSKGLEGSPVWPDFAGSGGGTANADFANRIQQGDRGSEQTSPRTVINTFYFKPPFRAAPDREEMYVDGLLSTKVGPGNYPGDTTTSENWPTLAPGHTGVNNALSPKYLNQSKLADIEPALPILWIRGQDDQIVSDTSFFDLGFLGQLGIVPGWPGAEIYPPQPMVGQMRAVLEDYKAKGGSYTEVLLPDCGHAPHIEKPQDVLEHFSRFIVAG